MSYPCILLAAGASSRMGANKLLLPLGNETVVRRAARTLLVGCSPLIVVTGRERGKIEKALGGVPDIIFTFNADWEKGMIGSAIQGIDALPDKNIPFFLHHADMPFISKNVLDALYAAEKQRDDAGLRPLALMASLDGIAGHPVLFPSSYIPAIRAAGQGERLKGIVEGLGCLLVETGCEAVLEDIDNPGEFAALCEKYGLSGKDPVKSRL